MTDGQQSKAAAKLTKWQAKADRRFKRRTKEDSDAEGQFELLLREARAAGLTDAEIVSALNEGATYMKWTTQKLANRHPP
jgi:hypothetical protein